MHYHHLLSLQVRINVEKGFSQQNQPNQSNEENEGNVGLNKSKSKFFDIGVGFDRLGLGLGILDTRKEEFIESFAKSLR